MLIFSVNENRLCPVYFGCLCPSSKTPHQRSEMDSQSPTQYHHYIPQFILRRFAIDSTPEAALPTRKSKKRRPQQTKSDKMVNIVDLGKSPPEIRKTFVRRTFGLHNMYKDSLNSADQMHVEKKFGEIEQISSRIIARVVDAHKAGKESITLSRLDKDYLRKFCFVMKYRSPGFFRRFNHEVAEDYNSADRTQFLKYMRTNGFTRPIDVWFDNLIKIIDAPMDPSGDWIANLFSRIYFGDAEWLFINIRSMYLVFVCPADPNEEFILTENAFGIHEGPVSFSTNRLTGEQTMTAYTEFHVLNIISPHLVMLLRHNTLPEPREDVNPEIRDWKRRKMKGQACLHIDPANATSLLEDLPVARAINSYTITKNERLVLAEGADGKPRPGDEFTFPFYRLETRHVQTINAIMLNEAHSISTIVFHSEAALRKAVEFYIDYPVGDKGGHSLRDVGLATNDPRFFLFVKLVQLARLLGSSIMDAEPNEDDDLVIQVLRTAVPVHSNHPVAVVMTVLMEVLERSDLTVGAVYNLDRMLPHLPGHPKNVYEVVQKAAPENFNQYTTVLRTLPLPIWKYAWDVLVRKYLQVNNVVDNQEELIMPPMLSHINAQWRSSVATNSRPEVMGSIPRVRHDGHKEQRNDAKPDHADWTATLSREGLRKAFDGLIHEEKGEVLPEVRDHSHQVGLANHSNSLSEGKVEIAEVPKPHVLENPFDENRGSGKMSASQGFVRQAAQPSSLSYVLVMVAALVLFAWLRPGT
ncbi:hypothetical protein FB567DRAFT_519249 [Paraphoma chrysanthemicola]|uniref:Uncharacterized protein n=1 Tax=Paraphoma chrysanthemicola TaxID=798071 RepID=A0A8K0RC43_9PLEO|nr:hypothetical protein FB567DRAFT_519249 [Paraphoma chrysanthemicola]